MTGFTCYIQHRGRKKPGPGQGKLYLHNVLAGGFWPPFAVAIAGGTLLTTLLSFYFVPAAFMLMSRRKAFEPTRELAVA